MVDLGVGPGLLLVPALDSINVRCALHGLGLALGSSRLREGLGTLSVPLDLVVSRLDNGAEK